MNKEIYRKAKAWDRLREKFEKGYLIHSYLDEMDDILQQLEPTYHNWDWAWQQLQDGKAVTWRDWAKDSYIKLKHGNGFMRRYSVLNNKVMDMGIYGINSTDKFSELGWTLYEEE
jgi:hypothetical protein